MWILSLWLGKKLLQAISIANAQLLCEQGMTAVPTDSTIDLPDVKDVEEHQELTQVN